MKIHDYYYNDNNKVLFVEFSTKEDGDRFYRQLELSYSDLEYYSPDIISEHDLIDCEENFIFEILVEFFKSNDLPDELTL